MLYEEPFRDHVAGRVSHHRQRVRIVGQAGELRSQPGEIVRGHEPTGHTVFDGLSRAPDIQRNRRYSSGGGLRAMNPDGTQKWHFPVGKGGIGSASALGKNGTIYVGSMDSHFYAINPDGSQKWRYRASGPINSSPALDVNGMIYFGSVDYYVTALTSRGAMKWKYRTHGSIWSSPAIGSNGILYVGSYDGFLYAIGRRTR